MDIHDTTKDLCRKFQHRNPLIQFLIGRSLQLQPQTKKV